MTFYEKSVSKKPILVLVVTPEFLKNCISYNFTGKRYEDHAFSEIGKHRFFAMQSAR